MIQESCCDSYAQPATTRAVHVRRSNMPGDFAIRGRLYDFKEITGEQMFNESHAGIGNA